MFHAVCQAQWLQMFTEGPNCYTEGPNCYTEGPNCYTEGPNCYTEGPNCYTEGPNCYTEGPKSPFTSVAGPSQTKGMSRTPAPETSRMGVST